jgi:hypothetical protein
MAFKRFARQRTANVDRILPRTRCRSAPNSELDATRRKTTQALRFNQTHRLAEHDVQEVLDAKVEQHLDEAPAVPVHTVWTPVSRPTAAARVFETQTGTIPELARITTKSDRASELSRAIEESSALSKVSLTLRRRPIAPRAAECSTVYINDKQSEMR